MKPLRTILISSLPFMLAAAYAGGPVLAQENSCDPLLTIRADDPLGYQPRGSRCEGRYLQDVAAGTLILASFTQSFSDFDPQTDEALTLDWAAPAGADVHLKAQGLEPRLYYRMDADCPAGSLRFHWPVEFLAALELSRTDIGVVALTRHQFGGQLREFYLPLRIWQHDPPAAASRYQCILLPGVELVDVFLSLALLDPDGDPDHYLKDAESLDHGYYPAEQPIAFSLPPLKRAGIYLLEIGATLATGGTATLEILFYH